MSFSTLREDLAAIRTPLRDRIDPKLAAIIAASVLVHLGIAVWAWTGDVDTGQAYTPAVAQRFYEETMDVRIPDEPVTSAVPGVAQPVAPHQVPAPIVKRVTVTATRPMSAPDPERLAMLMTGEEIAANGVGEMRRRRPGGDLDKQIAELGNHPVTIGHAPTERPRLGTDRGPVIDEPTLEHAPKVDRDPGRITLVPLKQPSSTTLSPELVIAKIQNLYIRGLQRCYQRGLVGDATLSGRVSLAFTINTAGHASDTEASGLTDVVDTCIQNQVASWQFPVPRNAKTSEPIEMPFALVLALQSN